MRIPRANVRCRRPALGIECLEARRVPAVTWTVSFDDPGQAFSAYYSSIRETLLAAGNDWGRYLAAGKGSIQVTVKFADLKDDILADAGSDSSVLWQKQGKLEIWEMSTPNEIRTGKDSDGPQGDATITIDSEKLGTDMWFDPTPANRDDDEVPTNKEDAYSVVLHELGHCLGFEGWRDWTTGALPGKYESRFDRYVTIAADGTPYFNGPAAQAAYGNQPVPLTYSNLMHFGNDTFGSGRGQGRAGDDLRYDLMNGLYTEWGRRYRISPLDIAVLQDIGLPASQEPVNTPPLVADIGDQTIDEDHGLNVPLIIGDLNTPLDSLIVTATSNNAPLLPAGSLTVRGTGANRTLAIAPAANQSGIATITVAVSDGSLSVSDTFNLTVTPVRDPPSLSSIADRTMNEDNALSVSFAVGDVEEPLSHLVITALSSDARVFPPGSIALTDTGEMQTLTMVPAANQFSLLPITISVTASDGVLSTTEQFAVTIFPVDDAPTISAIDDQFIATNGTAEVRFQVSDVETPLAQLIYAAESSNPALLSSDEIRYTDVGNERILSLVPRPGQEGTAAITLRFGDGQYQPERTFNVRVAANPFPWRNPVLRFDVDADSVVAPKDALAIINFINHRGAGPLTWKEAGAAAAPFYDVHADNLLAASDVLEVINYINDQILQAALSPVATAEGESTADAEAVLSLTFVPGNRRRR